jgi:hypothetical protein
VTVEVPVQAAGHGAECVGHQGLFMLGLCRPYHHASPEGGATRVPKVSNFRHAEGYDQVMALNQPICRNPSKLNLKKVVS